MFVSKKKSSELRGEDFAGVIYDKMLTGQVRNVAVKYV